MYNKDTNTWVDNPPTHCVRTTITCPVQSEKQHMELDILHMLAYGPGDGLCAFLLQDPIYRLYNFFVLLIDLNVQLMCPEAAILGLL